MRPLIHLNVWPVVQRELREGARRPINHRLRFWSAAVGTLLLWILVSTSEKPAAQLGGWLFASLHTMLLGLIFVIVPGLTADCIAREKRDGTLGLLFLTPLSAGGIVAGKALAQGLRAFTLWLAALPLLTIPFMTGGITWFDAFSALSLEFCAAVLCLAAGLLASSLARERNTAFLLAYLLARHSSISVQPVLPVSRFRRVAWIGVTNGMNWWQMSQETMPLFTGSAGNSGCARMERIGDGLDPPWQALGFALLWCSARHAADSFIWLPVSRRCRIERSWQDKIPPRGAKVCSGAIARRCSDAVSGAKCSGRWIGIPSPGCNSIPGKRALGKWALCLAFLLAEYAAMDLSKSHREAIASALLVIWPGFTPLSGSAVFWRKSAVARWSCSWSRPYLSTNLSLAASGACGNNSFQRTWSWPLSS